MSANPRMPRIGITADIDFESNLCSANHEYADAVWSAGGIPAFVAPIDDSPEYVRNVASSLDALILAGGGDIDPAQYGQNERHSSLIGVNAARDRFEVALTLHARRAGVPILGICRGMQLMNVALGGTLVQDIEEARRQSHASPRFERDVNHCQPKPFSTPTHAVAVLAGTRLHSIMCGSNDGPVDDGGHMLEVNSMHHQSVAKLSDRLLATAYCGSVIEALEDPECDFFLGVQWHPEYLKNGTALFRALIEAAR